MILSKKFFLRPFELIDDEVINLYNFVKHVFVAISLQIEVRSQPAKLCNSAAVMLTRTMLTIIIGTEKRGLAIGVEAQPSGDLT